MSQQNYRFDPQDNDTYALPRNLRHNTTIRRSPYDEMDSLSGSFSSSTSLYTNPPSPALRPGIHPDTGERYTTLESMPHSVRAATTDSTRVPGPRIPDRYASGTRPYQACPQVKPTFESSGLSLTDTPYRPRTPPITLSPLSLEAIHQRAPGLTHPLPEPLPRFLRVARPDSRTSAEPSHTVGSASSSRIFTGRVEKTLKEMEKSAETSVGSMNALRLGAPENFKTASGEKSKMQVDLQDMTSKLETAFQDPRMNKGENAREKPLEKNWCFRHLKSDTCDAEERERGSWVPPSPNSPVEKRVLAPQPGASDSTVPLGASSVKFTAPIVDKVEIHAPKTIHGKACADSNSFVDLVKRQRASWNFHVQNNARLQEEAISKEVEQKKACERVLKEAKKSETQWRLEANKVLNDLKDIEKKVQANSRIPVCSKMEAPKPVPKNEPNISAKTINAPDKARDAVTSNSMLTEYIDKAARPRDDLRLASGIQSAAATAQQADNSQDLELQMVTLPCAPLASSVAAKQEDVRQAVTTKAKNMDDIQAAEAERVTTATRITAHRPGGTLATDAEMNAKWDSVELSDDEGWEKVVGDDDSDWEVVEE